MASNNINVNLLFQADTTAALRNIQQLAASLNSISKTTTVGVSSGPIAEAAAAARELQVHLDAALNTNTGKIDLTKLNNSLAASKTSLMDLGTKLQAIGPQGQQAFMRLATAISSAEAPMIRLSAKTKEFMTTLANTAKWQVASTAIHSIQGGLSQAVSHAKDLNRALTDIRIVTGYSLDYMANFTKEANAAAKALNTTSTEYAKASLIFFQQGLSGDAVSERAEVVIKLSQVTGQSAGQVSDQMTAIWNNFYDGSKSLEYYADAIAKLGAATAASTDEIVDGVEKFAAVAETAGLSYEYATAALATVVDKTKQSPEVIGTAFKTIFARIQGLKLGETLEDGTDLNKYSEALMAVGVNIKDAEGNIKDLDVILDELGSKWKTLSKDTQLAVSQTVGGLRQYNQMISLMDNWDDVKINVGLAESAEGTLEEQAEIYREGIDGATARLQQAKNELFEKFLDDQSIVNITNFFADLVTLVGKVIDSFGGFGPMLITIGALFSKSFFPLIISGFQKMKQNIDIVTGAAQKKALETQATMRQELIKMKDASNNPTLKQQIDLTLDLDNAQQSLNQKMQNATVAQKEYYGFKLKIIEALGEESKRTLEAKLALEEKINVEKRGLMTDIKRDYGKEIKANRVEIDDKFNEKDKKIIRENVMTQDSGDIQKRLQHSQQEIDRLEKIKKIKGSLNDADQQSFKAHKKNIELYEEELRLQQEIKKEKSYITDEEVYKHSFGKTEDSFIHPKDIGVNEDEQEVQTKMADNVAKEFGVEGGMPEEGLQVNASLENLEKAIALKGEYRDIEKQAGVAVDDFNKTMEEQAKAQNEANKSTKKYSKEQKNLTKQTEKTKTVLGQLKTSTMDLAKRAGYTEDEMTKLSKAFDNVSKGGKGSAGDIEFIRNALTKLENGAKNTADGLDTLEMGIIDAFDQAGLGGPKLDSLVSKLEQLGIISPQAANAIRQLNGEFNNPAPMTFGQRLQTGAMAIGTFAGQLSMVYSSVQMLTGALKDGKITGDEWMAVLMGTSMLLPTLIKMYSNITGGIGKFVAKHKESVNVTKEDNKVTETNTVETQQNSMADNAEAAAETKSGMASGASVGPTVANTVANKAETVGLWANVTAWLAKHAAMLNFAGVALATAAIAGITAMSIGNETEAVEESTAANEENAKSLKEILDVYNQFDSINEKFSEFAEGTKEWNEALDNTHKSLKTLYEYLLTINPEKAKEFLGDIKIVGGRWTMSDEDMEEYAPIFEEKERDQKIAIAVSGSGGYSQRKHERETYGHAAWSDINSGALESYYMENFYKQWKDSSAERQEELLQAFFNGQYDLDAISGTITNIGNPLHPTHSNKTFTTTKDQNEIRKWLQEKNALEFTDPNMGIIAAIQSAAGNSKYKNYINENNVESLIEEYKITPDQFTLQPWGPSGYTFLTLAGQEAAKQFAINSGYAKPEDDIEVEFDQGGTIKLKTKDAEGNLTEVGTTDVKTLEDINIANKILTPQGENKESYFDQTFQAVENFGQSNELNADLVDAFKIGNFQLLTEEQQKEIADSLTDSNSEMPEIIKKFAKDNLSTVSTIEGIKYVTHFDAQAHSEAVEQDRQMKISQIGMEASSLGFEEEDVEAIKESAKAYEKLYEAQGLSIEQAGDMAIANARLNRGIKTLGSNWEELSKDLKSANKESTAFIKAAEETSDALKDILNLAPDLEIPKEFYDTKNINLLTQALQGNSDAIDELGTNLSTTLIKQKEFNSAYVDQAKELAKDGDKIKQMAEAAGIDPEQLKANIEFVANLDEDSFAQLKKDTETSAQRLATALENVKPGEKLTGEALDAYTSWVDNLNKMAIATGMTKDEINSQLNSMNVTLPTEVGVTTLNMKKTMYAQKREVKVTGKNDDDPDTYTVEETITQGEPYTINEPMQVAQVNIGNGNLGQQPIITHDTEEFSSYAPSKGDRSVASSSQTYTPSKTKNKSGGDKKANKSHEKSEKSKDNKTFRAKEAELEIDRFEDEDRAIEKVQRSLDKLNRTKEEAVGTKYLNALDSENEKLYEQYKINEDIQSQAKKFLSQDLSKARSYGLNIEVDDEGMITNMEDVRTQIVAMENALERDKINDENSFNIEEDNRLNALLTNDDATNEQREAVQKDIEDRKKIKEKEYEERQHVIDQASAWFEKYDEEWQKYIETGVANEEILMQIRENNLEKITYKTEQLIELNEKELGILELMQSRIGESFREAPELFDVINKKYTDITDKGMVYVDQLEEAKEKLAAGEISQAGYFELLNSSYDGLSDAISSLIEYAEEMDDVMLNAFEDFNEELDTANAGFEHLISLTENYESLMELMGKNTDKELLSGLYKQRSFIAETAYQSSIQDYQWYANEYTKVKTAYDTAIAEGREDEAEIYVDELEMLKEQVHEKQLTMLDNAQQWAESMVAIRDVALEAAAETMQKALFGGMSRDQFDEYMESLQAKTEDYLTETNQQYETQKMIRTAMRDIEKTENEAAKRKLENFKKETAELQKQSKLSNFELEVQQAKYDLLLAEIALQEAQDAKSTVRLRRDAEGNFNYVYTADQDKVADAEQKYADAENNLYNIRLEGANEYAEKYVQIQQELADKIIEIQTNMELTQEERDARIAALKEDYYSRLENAQEIYNIAAEGLSDNLSEAWTTDMMDNIASVGEFKTYTTQYLSDCETAFDTYQKEVDKLSKLLKANYGDVEEGARKVKEEVDEVRREGIENLNALWIKTQDWARKTGQALDVTIAKWQKLLETIIETQRLTMGFDTDLNYMDRYQNSTTVEGAFQELLKRDKKTDMMTGRWDENVEELMKEINDQSAIMMNAGSLSEVFAAASRREAKLAWIKQEDLGLYEELISQIDPTEKIMKEMYEKLGYGDKFESHWQEILDGLAKLPKMYEDFNKDITLFDTGGYTGSWGPDGKYAMLHEKELVLNENDTQNLLDTVDIVRDLIDSFEYNNLINSIAGLKPISIESVKGGDFLEQEVTIHAEFPNVQDRNEIEDAIENLVLTASQFANRKS